MKIPYPLVQSSTTTWVTAPIILPSCIIGLPLIPWTIPPLISSSSLSVTSNKIFLTSLFSKLVFNILISNSSTRLLLTTVNIYALPNLMSEGEASFYNLLLGISLVYSPKIPEVLFSLILP